MIAADELHQDIQAPARVDVAFPLVGTSLPLDHGYALFGAMCRVLGDLHGASWLSVHPVEGMAGADGVLYLRPPSERPPSRLRLRVDPAQIPAILPLSGALLELDGHRVRVGVPNIYPLVPSPALWARVVVIKGFVEEGVFGEAVQRQLGALGVEAKVALERRRVVRIRGSKVVGFGVNVGGLKEGDSLKLQAVGLGGRRHFGCGVLIPCEESAG